MKIFVCFKKLSKKIVLILLRIAHSSAAGISLVFKGSKEAAAMYVQYSFDSLGAG